MNFNTEIKKKSFKFSQCPLERYRICYSNSIDEDKFPNDPK